MLVQKWLSLQQRALRTCFVNLKTQFILTLITSMMIGFILIWPTFLWVLSIQAKNIIQDWKAKAYFTFYIPASMQSIDREELIERIEAIKNVQSVTVRSPEQSLHQILTEDEVQQLLNTHMENPLPYLLEIHPDSTLIKQDQLISLYQKLAQMPSLESSKNDLAWFKRLSAFEHFLSHFSLLLLGVLMLGVTFLVSNTLRMVIHARYDEIQILKLIGAPQGFILRPFLYAGAFYGFLGAVVAVLSVDVIIELLQDYFKPLAVLYNYSGLIPLMTAIQILGILAIAIGLGWVAAWIFVRYYLNRIEPI